MATAGSATLDATGEDIFDSAVGCTTFKISCPIGSSQAALVHVRGLHDAGEFYEIAPGESQEFTLNNMGIRKVFAKSDGLSAEITYGIISRTNNS